MQKEIKEWSWFWSLIYSGKHNATDYLHTEYIVSLNYKEFWYRWFILRASNLKNINISRLDFFRWEMLFTFFVNGVPIYYKHTIFQTFLEIQRKFAFWIKENQITTCKEMNILWLAFSNNVWLSYWTVSYILCVYNASI